MVPQDEQALTYVRHQASKSLAALRVLAERTADCGRCLEGISEKQARFKPGSEWSVKEVLDHLIYATARAVIEPIRDLGTGKPLGPSHRTAPVVGRCSRSKSCERRWVVLAETVALVGSLPEGDMPGGTWEHPSLGPLNLKELIALHRLHVMDHVQQIEKIKAEPGYPRAKTNPVS